MIKSFIFKHFWRNIILFNLIATIVTIVWIRLTNKTSYTIEYLIWIIADIILYRGRTLTFSSKGIYKHTYSISDSLLSDISANPIIIDHEFIDFSNIKNLTILNHKNKSVLIISYLCHLPIFKRSITRTLKITPKNYNTTIEELLEYIPKNIPVIYEEDEKK